MLFGIRNKIILCFLVPVIFMIAIGTSAYQKAAQGLNEKFRTSTVQTIEMAGEYIDMICTFIEAEGLKYAFDKDLQTYLAGRLEDSPMERRTVLESISANMLSSQTGNPFISDIHIVTRENIGMISTATRSRDKGILDMQ